MASEFDTNRGAIKAVWHLNRDRLPWMKQSQRNAVFRSGMQHAAFRWREQFLPLRFTDYVMRKPFQYHGGSPLNRLLASLGTTKKGAPRPGVGGHGALHDRARAFIQSQLFGWNPYSDKPPPDPLIARFKAAHPGKYKSSITGMFGGLKRDVRAWAKAALKDKANGLASDGLMPPLILTGDLRASVGSGQITATATAKRLRAAIALPFPGPRAKAVGRILRLVPHWELRFVAESLSDYIQRTEWMRNVAKSKVESAAAAKQLRADMRASREGSRAPRSAGGRPARRAA